MATTIELSDEAAATLAGIEMRLWQVKNLFGETSDEYLKMLHSAFASVLAVMRLGGTITPDGELGLYGVSFIHYGMVFHPVRTEGEHHDLLGEWQVHS